MKFSSPRSSLFVFFATAIAFTSISSQAETRCPGNIAGLRPRLVAGALLVIPVRINQSGPFDFMVDTGSQITVIDPALASELRLKLQGSAGLVSVSGLSQASVGVLDSIEADKHTVTKAYAVVQDLGAIREADSHIRGVLGLNFLSHFGLLIDYRHNLLCLDETGGMQDRVRGEHIALVKSRKPDGEIPFTECLVIAVQLSGTGQREIRLQLDSGSDGPILYGGNGELGQLLRQRAKAHRPLANDPNKTFFAPLPPQDMKLGTRTVRRVPFVTPTSDPKNIPDHVGDGILATVLFQRVFVSQSDRFVIFDPK
ncbi:MAG TPA: retropepsin-like aspartic protease [Terracidiphilus sp.]|jgi:hypothetical protein